MRRKWQSTPLFLPGELHEQHEKGKYTTLEDELPRSEGVQNVTLEEQRAITNSSRKKKKKKQNAAMNSGIRVSFQFWFPQGIT